MVKLEKGTFDKLKKGLMYVTDGSVNGATSIPKSVLSPLCVG